MGLITTNVCIGPEVVGEGVRVGYEEGTYPSATPDDGPDADDILGALSLLLLALDKYLTRPYKNLLNFQALKAAMSYATDIRSAAQESRELAQALAANLTTTEGPFVSVALDDTPGSGDYQVDPGDIL